MDPLNILTETVKAVVVLLEMWNEGKDMAKDLKASLSALQATLGTLAERLRNTATPKSEFARHATEFVVSMKSLVEEIKATVEKIQRKQKANFFTRTLFIMKEYSTLDRLSSLIRTRTQEINGLLAAANMERVTLSASQIITDPEAARFWTVHLEDKRAVRYNTFIQALEHELGYHVGTCEPLRLLLDASNDGKITMYEFNNFLQLFAPFRTCLQRAKDLVMRPYFAGFLTRESAVLALSAYRTPKSFLVRWSVTNKGNFAISYVMTNGEIDHALIYTRSDGKVSPDDDMCQTPRLYESVHAYISTLGHILQVPLKELEERAQRSAEALAQH